MVTHEKSGPQAAFFVDKGSMFFVSHHFLVLLTQAFDTQ
jgi:hypothetical protein